MFYASQRKFRIIMNKVIEKYTEHFAQNQNTWKEKKKKKKTEKRSIETNTEVDGFDSILHKQEWKVWKQKGR